MNRDQINALSPEPLDRRFLADAFARLPQRWAQPVGKTYSHNYRTKGRKAANLAVLDVLDSVEGFRFGVASNEDGLRDFAKARADECFRAAARYVDADMALEAMRGVALRYGIQPPSGRNVTKTGERARLLDDLWWRRQARKVAGRNVEGAAVKVGLVHRYAGLYVSDETLQRRAGQKRRNRALLESIIAINDAESGRNEYTLQELSDLGVSNPEKRRMELMTRLAGFDELAVLQGHAAEFYTLTAPSKFHARESITGKENRTYSGIHPKETQVYLCGVWSRARAELHRLGIRIYGFRVCEPHHDGTPHWHMVMFMQPEHVETVRQVMRKHALKVDGSERGADVHRFKAEAIDRKKGSAVGYLAKYIAKNIDGYGVGDDWEGVAGENDATTSARRVDAWAACWGIRQFQQIGGASVTVWRELRRMNADEVEDLLLRAIVQAADAGGERDDSGLNGWARFTNLMGGPFAKRKDATVSTHYVGGIDVQTGELLFNKYGEIAGNKIKGVLCDGQVIETRLREWVFQRSGAAVSPWSSVNNCTRLPEGAEEINREFAKKIELSAQRAEFCPVDWSIAGKVRGWEAFPAYMQRVRAGISFDGRGMVWQEQ